MNLVTAFANRVLRIGQQPDSAVKTLSGRIAPLCGKHQFCDKKTVIT